MKDKAAKKRRPVILDRAAPTLRVGPISPIRGNSAVQFKAEIPSEAEEVIKKIIAGEPLVVTPVEPVNLQARARAGDCEPLIEHFATGGELTTDERRIITALARGVYPKPIHRAKTVDVELFARDVAVFMGVLKLVGGKNVPDIAAEKFNIDRTSASKHFKRFPDEAWNAVGLGRLFLHYGADPALARRVTLKAAGITDDDVRRAMARKPRRPSVINRGK